MKPINLTLCSCNRYLERNLWKPYHKIEDVIARKIREQLPGGKPDLKSLALPVAHKEIKKNTVSVMVNKEEKNITVTIKMVKCDGCAKEGTNYFESILQVRSLSHDALEKSIDFLKRRVENLRNRGLFINKVEQTEDGFDLYLTNRRLTQMLGKELFETFGGIFKASPQLFTRNKQTSKNVYRMNVLVRIPDFTAGDIILVDDKVYKVDKLGAKIKLLNIETKAFVNMDYAKMTYHKMKKHTTYVSRTQPYIEAINPYDFQSSMVKNKVTGKLELGQEVTVIIHKGMYVIE